MKSVLSDAFKILSGPVKYMELDGKALGYNWISRRLLQPSFMGSAFAAASLAVLYPQIEGGEILKDAAIGYIAARATRKYILSDPHKGFDYKIITTMPTSEQIRSSLRYRYFATQKSRDEFISFAMMSTIYGLKMQTALAAPSSASFTTLLFAPVIADMLAHSYRYNRISNGKSALIDYPAPGTYLDHLSLRNT